MCLIVVGWRLREDYPLMLAANRDEFFARPAAPADFWEDHRDILAGRDLLQGGTWLGLTRSGRLAAVTNFRDGRRARAGQRSRGWLVRDYLLSEQQPAGFLAQVRATARRVRWLQPPRRHPAWPVPLLQPRHRSHCPAGRRAWVVQSSAEHALAQGRARPTGARRACRHSGPVLAEALFGLLADRTPAPDEALPDTGIGLEWERLLSTAFIRSARLRHALLDRAAGGSHRAGALRGAHLCARTDRPRRSVATTCS